MTDLSSTRRFHRDDVLSGVISLLTLSILSDGIARVIPAVGPVSSILFLSLLVVAALYSLSACVRVIFLARKHAHIWFVVAVFVIVTGLIAVGSARGSGISGEATQEVACGMAVLERPWDGWQTTCFLGYPVRQYVMMALPSWVFGRSIVSLHLGIAGMFLGGLIVFLSGILMSGAPTLVLTSIAVGLAGILFHAGFVSHFLFQFEQSIVPVSLCLFMVGTYLWYRGTGRIVHLIMGAIALSFAAVSYTPALVLWPLAFGVSIHMWSRLKTHERPYIVVALLLLSVELIVSLLYRKDLRFSLGARSSGFLIKDIQAGIRYLTVGVGYYPFGTWVLKGALGIGLIVLLLSGIQGIVVASWIVGVILIAIVSKGYVWYGVDFRLHRTIVMLPVLLTSFLFLQRYIASRVGSLVALGIALCIFVSGGMYAYTRLISRPPSVHYAVIDAIRSLEEGNDNTKGQLSLFVADSREHAVISIGDELAYFYPNIHTTLSTEAFVQQGCVPPGAPIVVIHTAHACYGRIAAYVHVHAYHSAQMVVGRHTYLVYRSTF